MAIPPSAVAQAQRVLEAQDAKQTGTRELNYFAIFDKDNAEYFAHAQATAENGKTPEGRSVRGRMILFHDNVANYAHQDTIVADNRADRPGLQREIKKAVERGGQPRDVGHFSTSMPENVIEAIMEKGEAFPTKRGNTEGTGYRFTGIVKDGSFPAVSSIEPPRRTSAEIAEKYPEVSFENYYEANQAITGWKRHDVSKAREIITEAENEKRAEMGGKGNLFADLLKSEEARQSVQKEDDGMQY